MWFEIMFFNKINLNHINNILNKYIEFQQKMQL